MHIGSAPYKMCGLRFVSYSLVVRYLRSSLTVASAGEDTTRRSAACAYPVATRTTVLFLEPRRGCATILKRPRCFLVKSAPSSPWLGSTTCGSVTSAAVSSAEKWKASRVFRTARSPSPYGGAKPSWFRQ
jgi:hypothetical protein